MPQTQTMLEKVKLSLRISSTSFDSQINGLIDAAILDLTKFADIKAFSTSDADAIQTNAVIAYVSYNWFKDEKYLTAYNNLKMQMSTSSYYRPSEVVPDV